jgi:phytol kinase
MWFDPLFANKLAQDIVASVVTLAVALLFLRALDAAAARGWIEHHLSRKIIHIGTGPLFILCWNLFSLEPRARFLAALVPLAITLQFFLVGVGVVKDPAAVQAMTRTGNPREILRGPLLYGLIFVVCTVVFWRTSPVGILALMLMCGGDGLADIIGRRWGTVRLPINPQKSWAGSAAMAVGGFVFAFGFVALFQALGLYHLPLSVGAVAVRIGLISVVTAVIEALPLPDIDNLTTTTVAIVLAIWLL